MEETLKKYGDIINLPHHEPDKNSHPRMSVYNRAAQFAPFAALTGYEEAVKESARLTNRKIPLDDTQIRYLTNLLNNLKKQLSKKPEITVTYFEHDNKKPGGEYISFTGNLKIIDEQKRILIFCDNKKIKLNDIYQIIIENREDQEAF